MPYKPNEDAYAYLNLITSKCTYFHLDGRLWSADKFGTTRVALLMMDPKVQQNLPVLPQDKYK
jgi:hypothetical protein